MVRAYLLDGAKMTDSGAMHDHLQDAFALPEYYGRNLDALWDCLTEREPGTIVLKNMEQADRECLLKLTGLFTDLVRADGAWELRFTAGGAEPERAADPGPAADGCDGDCEHCTIAHAGDDFVPGADAKTAAAPEAEEEKGFFEKLGGFFGIGKDD